MKASVADGLSVRSGDGRFVAKVGTILIPRVGVDVPDAGDVAPFARIHLARLLLSGNVLGPRVRYMLGIEATREPYLRDLELTFEWRPELQLRMGRFRMPFSREFLTSRAFLQLMDRSFVSDFFRAGRGTGLSVDGRLFDGVADYRVGIYDDMSGMGPAEGITAAARIGCAPFGDLAFDETTARRPGRLRLALGLNAYTTVPSTTGQAVDVGAMLERNAGGLDVALRAGPVDLLVEGFVDRRRYFHTAQQVGAGGFAHVGVFLLPATLELAGRVGGLLQDVGLSEETGAWRADVGATYYLPEAGVKLQAGYGYTSTGGAVRALSVVPGQNVQLQAVLAF